MNILFVCTGNSCRSVMAEGMMKKISAHNNLDIAVKSAGISAPQGFPATDETVRVMLEEGVDVSGHQTTRLTPDLVEWADKIFVMENMHRHMVLTMDPSVKDKVHLLTEFSSDEYRAIVREDIPDPIGKWEGFYKNTLAVIKDCVEGIVKRSDWI